MDIYPDSRGFYEIDVFPLAIEFEIPIMPPH